MNINKDGNWKAFWGGTPLPDGARSLGTVTRAGYDEGALIKMETGVYVQGNAGILRSLPQSPIIAHMEMES